MNNLSFIEPVFLWALFSVIAVVVIHFLKRPKTVTLFFPTLRFFDKATITSYKTEKIRKWLLLFIRIIIFIFIILLFANPSCNKSTLQLLTNLQNELYVIIDPTPSMSYKVNNITLGDSAMRILDTIVKIRKSEKGIFVYNHKDKNFQKYTDLKKEPFYFKYYYDKKTILQSIENIIKNSKRPVFLILSDFQEESTLFFESLFSYPFSKEVPVVFISLVPTRPSNIAIIDVITNSINENNLYVKLHIEGDTNYIFNLMATFESVRIPSVKCTITTDTTISFPLPNIDKTNWGKVILEVNDPLSFDNTYYFTKSKIKKYSVLIIGEEKKNFPLQIALRSTGNDYWKVENISPEKITPQIWEDADLLIFNNIGITANKIIENYKENSKRKKAYIYAINCDNKDSIYFKELLFKGKIVSSEKKPLSIILSDTISNLWKGFPYIESKEVKIYTFFSGLSGTPLLRLSNGQNLGILYNDLQNNLWFIIGTPLGITDCNNLCETGFYVPFLDRICRYLCKSLDTTEEKWIVGKGIKNPWYKKKDVQILTLENKPYFQLKENSFIIEEPGIYKVIPEGASPFLKAVIADSSESWLKYRLPYFNNDKDKSNIVISASQIVSYLKKSRSERIREVLWLLLIIFIGLEIYLRKSKYRTLEEYV